MTTTQTPAAELHAAANRLRELAGAATPGRWVHLCMGSDCCQVIHDAATIRQRREPVARFGSKRDPKADHADAEFVARMDPVFALAVADWLEAAAERADGNPFGAKDLINAALAVARTYLESAPVAQIPND